MITVIEKRKGINRAELWYAKEKTVIKGFISYREAKIPLTPNFRKVRTLLSDLRPDENEIMANFTKNCRYEIRRAPRENVSVHFHLGMEITEQLCKEFVSFFVAFWHSRAVELEDRTKLEREIRKYASQGNFAITYATIDNIPIVYHTYIVGEDIVRLYQSASLFREDIGISQSVIGMANRYLHKEDMLWFKHQGKLWYDWGGAGERKEVASITKFKEAFGGTEAFFYDGEEITGWKAKLWKQIVVILNAVEKKRQGRD